MRILHVFYAGLGGHSNVFFSMLKADESGEFQYEVLLNGIEQPRSENTERCEKLGIKWQYVHKTPGKHLAFIWQMAKLIRHSKPGIVFLHASINVPAALLAKLLSFSRFKIIVRETQANHLKTKTEWFSLKLALLFADKIVFLTEAYNSTIKETLPRWYKQSKVTVIPNGLDLDLFKPAQEKIFGNPVVLGMQSRIVAIKDHVTLLNAVAIIKTNHPQLQLKLKIAGEGNMEPELKTLAHTLDIESVVEFTGLLPESALPRFLQTCDIYIHASLGETMSTAIMQAMACRLPIIASDVDGINNMLVNRVTALLVKPKEPQQLADAIMECINKSDLCSQLADNAYAVALQKFSNKKMFESYKAIFTK